MSSRVGLRHMGRVNPSPPVRVQNIPMLHEDYSTTSTLFVGIDRSYVIIDTKVLRDEGFTKAYLICQRNADCEVRIHRVPCIGLYCQQDLAPPDEKVEVTTLFFHEFEDPRPKMFNLSIRSTTGATARLYAASILVK